MEIEKTLEFVKTVLGKQRIPVHVVAEELISDGDIDFGLRRLSNRGLLSMEAFTRSFGRMRPRVVYKMSDYFLCCYISLILPDEKQQTLLIGPYTRVAVDRNMLLEAAALFALPPSDLTKLEDCYGNIPCIPNDSFLFSLVFTLADTIWGKNGGYEVMDLNEELEERRIAPETETVQPSVDEMAVAMQLMEQRYAWENELMQMVSRGQSSRAEKMLPDVSNLSFKQRHADPLRNIKNYCIVCNTLMRKAAQQGGVHPMYLDSVSSEYAIKIEAQEDVRAAEKLVMEMIHNYCRLVKKHSMKEYSLPVRRAIILIDSQLASELSLRHIAAVMEVNPSYLSNLFRKETGQTITDFIARRRVEQASNFLRNSSMQIHEVAIYCGIPDANYFSKVFKKYTGFTPAEYRNLPQPEL